VKAIEGEREPDASKRPDERAQLHSSLTLLQRARAGDRAALDLLIARYLPRMERWARGRLPRWARDMADTQDVVQEALFQSFSCAGSPVPVI
jgi:hypothetical protein